MFRHKLLELTEYLLLSHPRAVESIVRVTLDLRFENVDSSMLDFLREQDLPVTAVLDVLHQPMSQRILLYLIQYLH